MGSSSSKPTPDPSPQSASDVLRTINAPIVFTNTLISHLDSNKESNSTRAATLEAQIQSRVQSELARLESRSETLQQKVHEAMQKAGLLAERANAHLSAVTLGGDIKELRGKFVGVKEGSADKDARRARDELVSCLRVNDRRGLDCWWEVKQFREKVGRLEREFVEKNQ